MQYLNLLIDIATSTPAVVRITLEQCLRAHRLVKYFVKRQQVSTCQTISSDVAERPASSEYCSIKLTVGYMTHDNYSL